MIPVDDVVEFVSGHLSQQRMEVGVYWHECRGGREKVREALSRSATRVCLVPLVAKRGFDNPNAVSSDLTELLDAHRTTIEPVVTQAAGERARIAIVLISRTSLDEPLIGSAVTMPDWFPYYGGSAQSFDIIDVAGSATVGLRTQNDSISRLQTLLYEVEGLVISRLVDVRTRNHNATSQFFSHVLAAGEKADTFLATAGQRHQLQTADGFRSVTSPETKELLGRIVGKVTDMSAATLPKFSAALFDALEIGSAQRNTLPEPLFAVAFRSTIKENEANKELRSPRNIVLAIYAASQIVTATAHAGEYGQFYVVTIRSLLHDLKTALSALKDLLN